MAVLQFLLQFLVRRPFLSQWFVPGLALEDAAPALDQRRRHRLEKDAFGRGLDDGLGAVFDMKFLPQPAWDDDLPFGGKPDRVRFCGTHGLNLTNTIKSVNY